MARTPTFEGKDLIKLFLPSKAFNRQASWLYSTIRFSPPAKRMNLHNKKGVKAGGDV